MSINVQVSPIPNINILVGNSGNLLNLLPQDYTLHANTHISGGIDSIDHNYLLGLQGGQNNEYYHLNSGQYTNLNSIINSTGTYTLHSETGAFYASSNPSGFIMVTLNNPSFSSKETSSSEIRQPLNCGCDLKYINLSLTVIYSLPLMFTDFINNSFFLN